MDSEEGHEHDQFEGLIQGLIDNNFSCCDDFILLGTVNGLRDNIQRLNDDGNMKTSGIGNNDSFHKDNAFRGDTINWIADESTNPFEQIYLKKIENFIVYLNRSCYTSIRSFESHYAYYEKGRFYKRHLDQFKDEKGRQFSIILYLNDDWKEEDGGLLSLYPAGAKQMNIAPKGGRLVFFRSDEMEHEVHPSHTRDRRSIAAWLKR